MKNYGKYKFNIVLGNQMKFVRNPGARFLSVNPHPEGLPKT